MMLENRVIEEMKVAVDEAKKAARSAASVRRKDSSVTFSNTVVSEAEALKASNIRKPAAKSGKIGTDMNDIRGTPGLRGTVESLMNEEVYVHASLACTPNATPEMGSMSSVR